MSEPSEKEFSNFVNRYLIVQDAKCYRHCQNGAKFVALKVIRRGLSEAISVPGNYASRVVYFSLDPDRDWFENFLQHQVGDRVRSKDIRSATRHGWELRGRC